MRYYSNIIAPLLFVATALYGSPTLSAQDGIYTPTERFAKKERSATPNPYAISEAPRLQVGLNVGVLPTLEAGVALSRSTTLHLKGTYIPNFLAEPHHAELWMVAPVLKFWLADNWDVTERFKGLYIEAGIPFVQFDAHYAPFLGEEHPGARGWSTGASIGFGYAFKVGEQIRITPNFNTFLSILPQVEYYINEPLTGGPGYAEKRIGRPTIPGLIIPLELGVKLEWVY